jgi:hypothetical protein
LPCRALVDLGGHDAALVNRLWSDPTSGRLVGATPVGETVADAEVIVVQGYVAPDAIRAARRGGQVVIADLTDTLEVPTTHVYHDLLEPTLPAGREMYRACDAITVSSGFLREYAAAMAGSPPVFLLRNPLDVAEWGAPNELSDGPVLGWCGTLAERADDCSVLRPWLGDFLSRHDLRFIHVGDGEIGVSGHSAVPPSFAAAAGVDPDRVERRPVRTFPDYLATRPWAGIDIQLVPLMDHPYSRGKSCLKGLEAAAQGIPFVASPQEEYLWLGCGRLAGSDIAHQGAASWITAVEPLLDPDERLRVAAAARVRVAQEDISIRWREWEAVYGEILASRRG